MLVDCWREKSYRQLANHPMADRATDGGSEYRGKRTWLWTYHRQRALDRIAGMGMAWLAPLTTLP